VKKSSKPLCLKDVIIDAECKQVIYYVKLNLTCTDAVPFVEIDAEIFLTTIIPSRKATK
jgi:hypothetical protein